LKDLGFLDKNQAAAMCCCVYFGRSFFSLLLPTMVLFSAVRAPAANVGGTLTSNTTWSGSIVVDANVVVPAGI